MWNMRGYSDAELDSIGAALKDERARRAGLLKTCAQCGSEFAGRADARFCSGACRVAAHRATRVEVIPHELRSRSRWVRHVAKRPVTVSGSPASSTDASTWSTYESARTSTAGDGLGFALGEGIGCIDLDHCLVDGRPNEVAEKFLSRLPRTYVEVSPSGDGLHVFGFLEEGPGSRRVVDGLSVEVYSVGRYMTVTGDPLQGSVSRLADLTGVVP